jgi:hypothetical protein
MEDWPGLFPCLRNQITSLLLTATTIDATKDLCKDTRCRHPAYMHYDNGGCSLDYQYCRCSHYLGERCAVYDSSKALILREQIRAQMKPTPIPPAEPA